MHMIKMLNEQHDTTTTDTYVNRQTRYYVDIFRFICLPAFIFISQFPFIQNLVSFIERLCV